jgi:hypothetical protein
MVMFMVTENENEKETGGEDQDLLHLNEVLHIRIVMAGNVL